MNKWKETGATESNSSSEKNAHLNQRLPTELTFYKKCSVTMKNVTFALPMIAERMEHL